MLPNIEGTILFSQLLKESVEEFSRWYLTVSEFREVHYFNIREYFLDFEGNWQPTKKGISIPLELSFTKNLADGLKFIVSEGEIEDEFRSS